MRRALNRNVQCYCDVFITQGSNKKCKKCKQLIMKCGSSKRRNKEGALSGVNCGRMGNIARERAAGKVCV